MKGLTVLENIKENQNDIRNHFKKQNELVNVLSTVAYFEEEESRYIAFDYQGVEIRAELVENGTVSIFGNFQDYNNSALCDFNTIEGLTLIANAMSDIKYHLYTKCATEVKDIQDTIKWYNNVEKHECSCGGYAHPWNSGYPTENVLVCEDCQWEMEKKVKDITNHFEDMLANPSIFELNNHLSTVLEDNTPSTERELMFNLINVQVGKQC